MASFTRNLKDGLLELRSFAAVANARYLRKGKIYGAGTVDPAAENLWRRHLRFECVEGKKLAPLHTIGYRVFSQFDEDGIVQALLAVLDIGPGLAVEIGIGDGSECNTAHLLLNHGWHGLLIDTNARQVRRARRMFKYAKDTKAFPPRILVREVTPSNVESILSEALPDGEVDLLSLDIDSIDYWVLRNIGIRPKILIVEVRGWIPAERAITVDSSWQHDPENPEFYGQSLAAAAKAAAELGFTLVGVNKYCSNAFFVRDDILSDALPTPTVDECCQRFRATAFRGSLWPAVSKLGWVDV